MGSREAAGTEMPVSGNLRSYGHFIDGASVAPAAGAYLPTEDPFTGATWAHIARGTADDANAAVEAADRAFHGPWSRLSATERGHLLWRLGDLVQANAAQLAETERRDNGKLATEVVAQVKYMGDYFKYYAGLADKVQSHVIPSDKKGVFAYTKYEPKGVVVIITPWNSPLTLTSWKLAPALAMGCTAVVKPSEFTSASMLEFAGIFAASGQSRQAGSRLLVQETIHDRFVQMLVDFVKSAKMGDPAAPDTQIGPIATRPQFEKILGYIDIAKKEGAQVALGGK